MPLLRGRAFTAGDGPEAPGVAIINAAFAARHFKGQDPIGKRLRIGGAERPDNHWLEIVGVVSDVHYSGVEKAAEPALYMPFRQNEWQSTYLLLRTRGDPNVLIAPVRQMIGALDGELAVTDIRTMRERFDA